MLEFYLNYYKFCVQRNKIHNIKNNVTKESNAKSKYNYSPILRFVTLSLHGFRAGN